MHPRIKIKQEIIDSRNLSVPDQNKNSSEENNSQYVDILQNIQRPMEALTGEMTEQSDSNALTQEDIKNMLKWKINQQNLQKGESPSNGIPLEDQTENMVNVLTSIALQQLKNNSIMSTGHSLAQSDSNERDVPIPSPVQDVVVSGQDSMLIDSNNQTYYVRSSTDSCNGGFSDTMGVTPQGEHQIHFQTSNADVSGGDMPSFISDGSENMGNEMVGDGSFQPCPICGDSVSGYHYGIFTCESCKGFFKRTVQNNKSFNCHRNNDCEVSRGNRKKCPSCRFAKCVAMGMKTQAVRLDRTRGGRSSYDGCSPRNRPKIPMTVKKPKVKKPTPNRSVPIEDIHVTLPSGEDVSGSQLMAILNKSGKNLLQSIAKPVVPQILTDIMSMESFLCDDEVDAEFPMEKISETDPNVIMSMLQLAELRLYKLVRWARNLPQFSTIATDDQILLLQNSWCEILTLICCYKSIDSPSEIHLPFGKSIDLEKAVSIGHGVDDIISRMLAITEHLRRLQVDQHEFVALKVLILISPDIKGMKDPTKAVEHQDAITDALRVYTESHFPQMPSKYGEMLMRLIELAKISMITKEALNSIVPPSLQSCGLLFELLKGDTGKDDS